MISGTSAAFQSTGPKGRWDLWLLGIGVVVLLLMWIVEPFFIRPPAIPGDMDGAPVARVNPPAGWFQGDRGKLFQERIVATPQYEKGAVTFDLTAEKKRLETWLSKDDNRDRLLRNPLGISTYHTLGRDAGGRISRHLEWFPHKVKADLSDSYSKRAFKKSGLQEHVVVLSEAIDPSKRSSGYYSRLVEYVPINMHERGFGLEDLDLTRSRASTDQNGTPVFAYHMSPSSAEAYHEVSKEHIGFECALIFRDYVRSVPHFQSPILMTSGAMMQMDTQGEARAFVEEIRALLPGR